MNQFAVFLLIAAGNAAPIGAAAELLFVNGRGHTPTADGFESFASLLVGDDGRVIGTGTAALAAADATVQRIDLRGRGVLPGLIDAHGHVLGYGRLMQELDLTGSRSRAEALSRLAGFAAKAPGSGWIVGRGWNNELWDDDRFPSAADIDAVVDDRPVWLERIDGHAGWANSAALETAGIDTQTVDPVGGRIERDNRGRATGIVVDTAMAMIERQLPQPDRATIRRAMRSALKRLVALGLTGVHDAGIGADELNTYLSLLEDGDLPLRIYAMLADDPAALAAVPAPLIGLGGDRLTVRAVKIYTDGALGSRGAALLEPYSDDAENRGLPFLGAGALADRIRAANDSGFQAGIHAIGDRANRMTLDALASVQGNRPSPLRNRIEHAQIIAADDLPRFAALGVIASMQPMHATSDMNMAEDRVGAERIRGGYAWRSLLDSGAVIAAGSDFPVERANPFLGLHAAVTRQDRNGLPAGGWYPGQAMTRTEALRAFTLDAAFAAHEESRTGSLEAGKWADFIVTDRDYMAVPAGEIDDIRVLETWVAGERVFAADKGEN